MKYDVYNENDVIALIDLMIDHCIIHNKWSDIKQVIEKPYKYINEFDDAIMKEYNFLIGNGEKSDAFEHMKIWKITKDDL